MSLKTYHPVNISKLTAGEFRPGPLGTPHFYVDLTEDDHSLSRAICYALTDSDEAHGVVRLNCSNEFLRHPSLYGERIACTGRDFVEYVNAVADGAKGTEIEILAAANAWFVDVHVYADKKWKTYRPSTGKPDVGLYLRVTDSGYYRPVLCVTSEQSGCYKLCSLEILLEKVDRAKGSISDVSRRTNFYARRLIAPGTPVHENWIKVYDRWQEFLVWLGDRWWGNTSPVTIVRHVMQHNQVVVSEPLERAFGAVCSVTYLEENELKVYSIFVLDGMYACKEVIGLHESPKDIIVELHNRTSLAKAHQKHPESYFTRANIPQQMAPYKANSTVTIKDRSKDKHVCTLTLQEPHSKGSTPGRVLDVFYKGGIDPRGRPLSGFSIVFGYKGFAVICMRTRTMLSKCQHTDLREVLEKF